MDTASHAAVALPPGYEDSQKKKGENAGRAPARSDLTRKMLSPCRVGHGAHLHGRRNQGGKPDEYRGVVDKIVLPTFDESINGSADSFARRSGKAPPEPNESTAGSASADIAGLTDFALILNYGCEIREAVRLRLTARPAWLPWRERAARS